MPIYSLLTDTGGHASWLTLGDQTFVVRTLNQTISREFRSEQLTLNHNASEQLSQVRKGCHNSETRHDSSNLNNFGI